MTLTPPRPRPSRRRLATIAVAALTPAAITLAVHNGRPEPRTTPEPPASTTPAATTAPVVPAVPVSAAELARLPAATTAGLVDQAPADPTPYAATTGTVAHPRHTVPVFTTPGGPPVAALPAAQLGGSPTWLPVTATRPGWLRVLLPTRPNRSTGWITTTGVTRAHTDYTIRIALGAHRLTLLHHGQPTGVWPISAGIPATPTPTGRTFLLAEVADTITHYSPLTWPLGTHSTVLRHFAGGPATIAIHGWPNPEVFGHDASNGCVRIPTPALHALAAVPLGSLVTITA